MAARRGARMDADVAKVAVIVTDGDPSEDITTLEQIKAEVGFRECGKILNVTGYRAV